MRIALLLAACCCLPPLHAAVENANVEDAEHAPTVRENETYVAGIVVRNPNDRAVRVVRKDPSCTCTKLVLHDDFLLPHATTMLDVEIDNRFRSGPQPVDVTLYLSDPQLDPIDVEIHRVVRANVQVDAVPSDGDPRVRPTDVAFQDVYRYVTALRPDEMGRLKKRIRLSCPAEETPPGGLKVEGIDYPGSLLAFTTKTQDDGSILLTVTAKDADAEAPVGLFKEKATVRTNHPDKRAFDLTFVTKIAKDVGEKAFDPDSLENR